MKITLILMLGLSMISGQAAAAAFHFVALGDTAYNLERDLPIYERLIETINDDVPAFSIHIGDTWGMLECTRDNRLWIREWFDKYNHPLIYTPGDNEWTDCRKPEVLDAFSRVVEGKGTAADSGVDRQNRRRFQHHRY